MFGRKRGRADRAEPGRSRQTRLQLHLLSDAAGLPLVVGVMAANTHDSQMLLPMVCGIPAVRSRRGPRRRHPIKLHADKGYDYPELRAFCRHRRIVARIARCGIESSERLGRQRWKIDRSISWTFNYRRLAVRCERKARYFAAFLGLAAILVCFQRLIKNTT